MTIDDAVRLRLSDDGALAAQVAWHADEDRPAVFSGGRVPPDAGLPFVVVDVPSTDLADDTKTTEGREATLTVRCFAGPHGADEVATLAERVRALLHRRPIGVAPYVGWLADADGPVPAPTDRSMVGRSVSVRIRAST